ncbi:Gfo/Idh/MocA family oxidoreductase [Alkalinema sp. FACHB-956]|uniref:Gfo/Idh/MocA family protein n=1 Tax=Alkalinema sp. FACHB-956 TaxID=2692768 RepID=UPI001686308D|nr:Gfo/Idh/MocA family oxidoreductase [Alkalinema sp. FACHB-956]MBD2329423.1 Gfo/Idh/MocA family oxidoreductase [Alkalinema sp. FACHB-956]
MQPMNVAIFGLGRWGQHLLRNFLAHPQAHVRAIVDPFPANLDRMAQQFGLEAAVQQLTDWEAAIALPDLDAVVIATPAETHYPMVRQALLQGLHVLAEKPLTLDAASSLELCELAEKVQRQLVIDHTYLFHPAVLRGQAALEAKAIGDLRYGYATRTHLAPVRQDVDALWDLAIHDLAILNYWLGAKPVKVSARGQGWLQPEVTHPHRAATGLADVVWATVQYPSGFQATIHLAWLNCDKQRRLACVGSQGTLVFDELAVDSLVIDRGELQAQGVGFVPVIQQREVLDPIGQEPLARVCDHFLACVQQNQPSTISSGWLGADLVRVLQALSRSMEQDGAWVDIASLAGER